MVYLFVILTDVANLFSTWVYFSLHSNRIYYQILNIPKSLRENWYLNKVLISIYLIEKERVSILCLKAINRICIAEIGLRYHVFKFSTKIWINFKNSTLY